MVAHGYFALGEVRERLPGDFLCQECQRHLDRAYVPAPLEATLEAYETTG